MRKLPLALAGLAALSLVAGAAGPANAGVLYQPHPTHCWKSSKTFDLPDKPDQTIELELCIEKNGSYYSAWIDYAKWTTPWYDSGAEKRYYYFESFVSGVNSDGTVIHGTNLSDGNNTAERDYDFNEDDGSRTYAPDWAVVSWKSYKTGWHAGANVYFDIVGDGRGMLTWHLHPTLSF